MIHMYVYICMHACIHTYIDLYMFIGLHIYRVSWLIFIFSADFPHFTFHSAKIFRTKFPAFYPLAIFRIPHSAFYPYPYSYVLMHDTLFFCYFKQTTGLCIHTTEFFRL